MGSLDFISFLAPQSLGVCQTIQRCQHQAAEATCTDIFHILTGIWGEYTTARRVWLAWLVHGCSDQVVTRDNRVLHCSLSWRRCVGNYRNHGAVLGCPARQSSRETMSTKCVFPPLFSVFTAFNYPLLVLLFLFFCFFVFVAGQFSTPGSEPGR